MFRLLNILIKERERENKKATGCKVCVNKRVHDRLLGEAVLCALLDEASIHS